MKYVSENLDSFNEDSFFTSLNENFKEEDDEEMSDDEKKKLAAQKAKDGQAVIKKIQNNFKEFKKFAGNKWQEYRDFWYTQEEAIETVGQKGIYYNLYNSDYIVGVVANASGGAELKIFNTSQGDPDEYEIFVCKNPDVILAFNDFFKQEVEASMRQIITAHKAAMIAKKEADKLKAKEEKSAAKRSKLDSFLSESVFKRRKKLGNDY